MGHFYRAVNLANALTDAGYTCKFYLNENLPSLDLLKEQSYEFEVVDLADVTSGWEDNIITRDRIKVWVNDRLDTDQLHAARIKAHNIPLVTFDDHGTGAALSDINIAALAFDERETLDGARILFGVDYMILNPEIIKYKRLRKSINSVIITLGGSDTYGVTVKIVKFLAARGQGATIVIGPAFMHNKELEDTLTSDFIVKRSVPSLIEEFAKHDLAITGGGITPFEANASGLPCIVIANEIFEVPVGKELERLGGAVFAGFHEDLDFETFELNLPIGTMSHNGMTHINLDGCNRVVQVLSELIH